MELNPLKIREGGYFIRNLYMLFFIMEYFKMRFYICIYISVHLCVFVYVCICAYT